MGADIQVKLTAHDAESSVASTQWRRLGDTVWTEYGGEPVAVTDEGTTTIEYRSADLAGNVEATKTATVMIDKTAPETASDAAAAYISSATVSLAATDVLSGVTGITFVLDGGAETSGTQVFVNTAGPHSLRFWSTDAVGNVESSETVEFSVVYPTFVGLSADRSSVRLGQRVRLTADLRHGSPTGPTMDSRTVQLEKSGNGIGNWSVVATASTTSTGTSTFWVTPSATTHYRVVYPGQRDTYARSTSAPSVVEFVQPRSARLSVLASAKRPGFRSWTDVGGVLRDGSATGAAIPGQLVVLQTGTAGGWADSDVATTTELGAITFRVRPAAKSRYRLSYAGLPGVYLPIASSVATVTPKPSVGTPVAPKRMRTTTSRRVFGALKPWHKAGSKPVRIYRYRKIGRVWKRSGAPVKATVSDYGSYSHYSARIRLAKKGSWRLRAWAPADAEHAGAWSSGYDYVTVK